MSAHPAALRSAAAERNREPILEVLRRWLPGQGQLLEIASGSGQHAAHFAAALPGWVWQASDPEPAALASIAAWREQAALANLPPPLQLDVHVAAWPIAAPLDAVYCANMIHIAPWSACLALLRGAARHLAPAGQLLLYGPYLIDGVATAASNLAFDADLRARSAAWGLRRLSEVERAATPLGLALRERSGMPANNLLLRFARGPLSSSGS